MHKDIIWFLCGKAVKSFYAAKMLCEQGYATDAAILCRTLIEILFSILFINEKDSIERTERFVQYENVVKYKAWNKGMFDYVKPFISDDQSRKLELEDQDVIKRNYSEAIKKYPEFRSHGLPWTGEGWETIAKRFNLGYLYTIIYTYLSYFIHPTGAIFDHYVTFPNDSDASTSIGVSNKFITTATKTLMAVMYHVLSEFNSTFSVGRENELQDFDRSLSG